MLVSPSEFTEDNIILLSVSCVCLDLHRHLHRHRHLGPDAFVLHDYLILWLSWQPTYWIKTNKNTNKSLLCPSHLYHLFLKMICPLHYNICAFAALVGQWCRVWSSQLCTFSHIQRNNGLLKTECVCVSHFYSSTIMHDHVQPHWCHISCHIWHAC